MKASIITQHGDRTELKYQDIADPEVSMGEVIVKVKACAMNHLDIWVRGGLPGFRIPMPHVLGSDVAGVVAEVGPGVEGISEGDEVLVSPGISCGKCQECLSGQDNLCQSYHILGVITNGGYAEYTKVPAINIIPKPANIDFNEAASIPLVFMTAWHMLVSRAKIVAGEDVLVQAAGSGVGIAAIQIAKLFGCRVITTASAPEQLKLAEQLGADEVINYREKDFVKEVKKMTDNKGVGVVIDHIGGDTLEKALRALTKNGRLVTCGATSAPTITIDSRFLFMRHLNLLGSFMGTKAELRYQMQFFSNKKLKPVVDKTYSLQNASEAHQRMEERKNFGKIIINP